MTPKSPVADPPEKDPGQTQDESPSQSLATPQLTQDLSQQSTDSLQCGQTTYRTTQDIEASQARHAGLSQMLVPGPTGKAEPKHPKNKKELDKRKAENDDSESDATKRMCVEDTIIHPGSESEDESFMDSQETDLEPGGNKYFTPGESDGSQR